MCRNCSVCSLAYETNRTVSVAFLETKFHWSGFQNTNTIASDSSSQMVVSYSQHFSGQTFSTTFEHSNTTNRCKHVCLGSLSGKGNSSKNLVSRRVEITHKLSGNGSSLQSFPTFSSSNKESECPSSVRQYNSCIIPEQTRGDSFNISVHANMEYLATSNKSKHLVESGLYCRPTQCSSRSIVQNSYTSNRVDAEQSSTGKHFSQMGFSNDRSFCISSEQTSTDILYVDPPSYSSSIGCNDNFVGQNVCVCVSANMPGSTSSTVHETVSMHDSSDFTSLAETPLVSWITTTVSSQSNCIASSSQSVESASVSDVPISDMVAVDKYFSTEGFSKRARFLLKSSWRSGTHQDYNSKYKKTRSWCAKMKYLTVAQCADFLADLFHEGLQYRTGGWDWPQVIPPSTAGMQETLDGCNKRPRPDK